MFATNQLSSPAPLAVSVETAAHMLGISRATAFTYVRSGEIPSLKLGGRRLVRVRDLEAVLDRLATTGGQRA